MPYQRRQVNPNFRNRSSSLNQNDQSGGAIRTSRSYAGTPNTISPYSHALGARRAYGSEPQLNVSAGEPDLRSLLESPNLNNQKLKELVKLQNRSGCNFEFLKVI